MKRIFLAGLFHESHSFLNGATRDVDYTTFRGEDLVLKNQDNGSPVSAVLGFAGERDWEVIPSVYPRPTSSALDHIKRQCY